MRLREAFARVQELAPLQVAGLCLEAGIMLIQPDPQGEYAPETQTAGPSSHNQGCRAFTGLIRG